MSFPGPINATWLLEDGAAAVTTSRAGEVEAAARVFDCGAATLFDGFLIFDVTAIDTSGDQVYGLKLQACASEDFASGVIDLIAPALNMAGEGDQAVVVTNQVVDTTYRYLRLWIEVGGTSPSITLSAWLSHKDSLDDYSLAQLTGLMAVAATRFSNASQEFRAWAGGVVDGGPNGDGEYPLSDGFGNTFLVPCPARIAASAGISYPAVAALTARTTPYAAEASGPEVILAEPSIEALRRSRLFLHASRRTQDLQELVVGSESLGNYFIQVLNNDSGISYRAALNAVLNRTAGIIDPTLPPYNCKFDATFTRRVACGNGDTVIVFEEPVGDRAKVGHHLQLSNAWGFGPGSTTITEIIDNYRVRIADAPTNDFETNDCLFGTDDTAGLQAALYEARARSTYTYGKVVWLPSAMGLTGALKYYPRSGLYGKGVRQSTLIRKDDGALAPAWFEYWQEFGDSGIANEAHPEFVATQPAPLLRASSMYADFPAIGDMAIHGAKFCQQLGYAGITMHSHLFGTPGPMLPQVDSYPMFSRMHIVEAGWNGWEHTGSHSGSMFAIEIIGSAGVGLHMAGFDANITNILVIGSTGPGMMFLGQGVNNNLLNVKLSFNGVGLSWLYGEKALTNLVVDGSGNNITNMRVQESLGSSVWVGGNGNQFADVTIDDTGCIVPEHQPWNTGSLPLVRAAIMLDGATDNRFNDIVFGGAVHYPDNFATHAVFCRNNPMANSGRIVSKGFPKFDDAQYYDNGETTGAYVPRAVSTDDAGGIDASNRLTVDEELLSFYYP